MTPSDHIDALIAGTADWRGKTLARLRKAILATDPQIVEAWKWMGNPVWYRDGILLVAGTFKGKVKLTFANGAHLPDPHQLFNAGLDGNKWRSIDFFEGDTIDERPFKALVRAAIEFNQIREMKKRPARGRATPRPRHAAARL
jgi:hypothetical protein